MSVPPSKLSVVKDLKASLHTDGQDEQGARTHTPQTWIWQLDLLGHVRLRSGTTLIDHFHSRAVVALLARLALAPQRLHAREELMELLWPGVAPDKGRPRLRQSLSVLRSTLQSAQGAPEGILHADRQTVSLMPGAVRCDALELQQLLAQGDTARARGLYAGEFMPGHYDNWIVAERERLSELMDALPAHLPAPVHALRPPERHAQPRLKLAAGAPNHSLGLVPGLPAYWTLAFGQDEAVAELCSLLPKHRLVALLGPGGNGKTRLAAACAGLLATQHSAAFDRMAFVSLIDCTTALQFWNTVAHTLGLSGAGDAAAQVAAALADQRSLLVLDNCEQLGSDAVQAIADWLAAQPQAQVLVTSRRRLGLDGEQLFELPGLPLPARADTGIGAEPEVQTLAANPAVALFVDRARACRADFQLKPGNAAAVADLVRLLGGMPLAIELAASRLRALQPRELLRHLTEDAGTPLLDLLARPMAAASSQSRHASMRHVVAWSWQQLSPPVALLLRAMSVLAAPASAQLVTQVWAALAAEPGEPVAAVQAWLADALEASLVQVHAVQVGTEERTHYSLLQPVREYAAELTTQVQARQARSRALSWQLGFVRLHMANAPLGIAEIDAEMPQIHASIIAAVADGAWAEAAQLAVALRRHWEVDTRAPPPRAVVQALEQAQTKLTQATQSELRCETSLLLCFASSQAGDSPAAIAHGERALALAPDARRRAQALMRMAAPRLFSNSDSAAVAASLDEAISLAQQAQDVETECLTLRMQFLLLSNRSRDFVAAEAVAFQMQQKWEKLGHDRNANTARMDRASCWLCLGWYEQAYETLAACEQVSRSERYATGYILATWQLGRAAMMLRRADESLAAFRRCVRDSWAGQRLTYAADALIVTPGGLAISGKPQTAARLLGFAAPHWQRHFGNFYYSLERHVRLTRRLLRSMLGASRFEALQQEGARLTMPQAVALALDESAQ